MRLRIILLPLVACLTLAAAPLAHAGTYTVFGCTVPSGAAAPMNGGMSTLTTPISFRTPTGRMRARARCSCL